MAKEISVDITRVDEGGEQPEAATTRARNTCPSCDSHYREEEMVANLRVCAHCGYHFPVTARERIVQLVDDGTWSEVARDLSSADPLGFVDSRAYPERLTPPSGRPACTTRWWWARPRSAACRWRWR